MTMMAISPAKARQPCIGFGIRNCIPAPVHAEANRSANVRNGSKADIAPLQAKVERLEASRCQQIGRFAAHGLGDPREIQKGDVALATLDFSHM